MLVSRRSAYMGSASRSIMRAAGAASAAVNRRRARSAVDRAHADLAQRAGLKETLVIGSGA